MLMRYEGFLPFSHKEDRVARTYCVTTTSYFIDWRCPNCGSEAVEISKAADGTWLRDGRPSTLDEISEWKCNDCGHEADGIKMLYKEGDHQYKEETRCIDSLLSNIGKQPSWWRQG